MSKIHLDRLARKYGFNPKAKDFKGPKYRTIISDIIANNTEMIGRRVAEISKDKLKRSSKNVIRADGRRMVLPDVSDVLPKRSVFVRKAAESGKLISESLRDKLTKHLRDVMKEDRLSVGTGKTAGRVNTKIIDEYQKRITRTFENYTKAGKLEKVPANVKAIATTEVRSTINDVKFQYAREVQKENDGIEMRKIWVHNPGMSMAEFVRTGHRKMNGRMVKLSEPFSVPDEYGQITKMMHPHDPTAPPEQVINCKCDFDIVATRAK